MPLLSRLMGGIAGLLRRTKQEQELDLELQQFLETSIEDKVRVGMSRKGPRARPGWNWAARPR